LEFRKRVTAGYPELFGERDEEESETYNDFSETTQFAKRWGWYQSIYAIAQGDITRFDEVTNYKLTKCLTYLVFEKQKTDIERRQFERNLKR
jgi:hypothetical protein